MSLELKIKAKSLAAEVLIIKKEEAKLKRLAKRREKARQWTPDKIAVLYSHRKNRVSRPSRLTHLARMFLKGRAYYEVEQFAWDEPNWKEVGRMAQDYGLIGYNAFDNKQDLAQKTEEWIQHAKAYYSAVDWVERRKVGKIRVRPCNGAPEA